MSRAQASKTWLLWTGLVLAGLALVVMVGSGLETSRAQTPMNGVVEVGKKVNMPSCVPGYAPAPLYTITFSNTTGSEVILDSITDTLPDGFKFVDMHPTSEWLARPSDDVEPEIVWQGPIPIPAGSTLSLVYSVDTYGVAPSTDPFTNTVEAETSEAVTLGPATAEIRLEPRPWTA